MPRGSMCTAGSGLARLFAIHGHDLHFIRVQAGGIIELECDVFDDEGPDVVAKAVGVQMALRKTVNPRRRQWRGMY
jgi:phage gp45-like